MTEKFYPGANYGLDPWYGEDLSSYSGTATSYGLNTSSLGFPSDPKTANQLKAVSDKLNTGAKTIEVSGVNITQGGHMGLLDAIPKQHFDEIHRLKKLTGVDLTFHGPLVEASGIGPRGDPFDEGRRQQAVREMWRTVEQGNKLNPEGNTPIVFHSSSLGAPLETSHIDEKTGEEITDELLIVDKSTGAIQRIATSQFPKDYFKGEQKIGIKDALKHQNKEQWDQELSRLSFSAFQAKGILEGALTLGEGRRGKPADEKDQKAYLSYYKDYLKNPAEAEKTLSKMTPKQAHIIKENINEILHGETYLRGQYKDFKDMYNKAYAVAKKEAEDGNKNDLKILQDFRDKISSKINEYEDDPSKVVEFSDMLINGIDTLRKINPPQNREPLRNFMIDKSSESFAEVAFKSYKKFKENSPIIAIENPPVGQFALGRADELVNLVEASREKFIKQATMPKKVGGLGMSNGEAKKQAEKLIGLTWDTAHINTLQGMGYSEKQVLKEVEKAAPYVKHVHISDNFGLADTELPPGMGTAPIGKSLELIEGYNKQIKKIIETGDWFSKMGFQKTPILESFTGLGAPVYAAATNHYWSNAAYSLGGYFSGIGEINPQIHHNIYGAGFSGMPTELGGQFGGGQSRMSGTPIQ